MFAGFTGYYFVAPSRCAVGGEEKCHPRSAKSVGLCKNKWTIDFGLAVGIIGVSVDDILLFYYSGMCPSAGMCGPMLKDRVGGGSVDLGKVRHV